MNFWFPIHRLRTLHSIRALVYGHFTTLGNISFFRYIKIKVVSEVDKFACLLSHWSPNVGHRSLLFIWWSDCYGDGWFKWFFRTLPTYFLALLINYLLIYGRILPYTNLCILWFCANKDSIWSSKHHIDDC